MYKIYRKNNYLIIDNGVDISEKYLAKDIVVQEITDDITYEIYGILPKLGNGVNQLLHSVSIPNIIKEDDSPYTSVEWVDFYTVNTGFFFELAIGEYGSIPEDQFVISYSVLPSANTVPYQIWIVENSEGTQWLPGSLGGTYYPEGVYVSDGIKWIYHKDNYQATQSEVNGGIVTTKWVSPFTFENANKWNTKQATLVSGGNIKTINSNSILGSGDLSITSTTNLTASQSSTNVTINSDVGTDAAIPLGNGINAGVTINDYTNAEKSKLSGIASGATSNSSDATLLNRANHTGTQLASSISDFNTQVATTSLIKTNNLSDLSNITTAKTNLSLQNVDNTSDINKPVSTVTQTALNLKANLASPTFTGTVSGITASMVGAPSGSGNSSGTNTGDNSVNSLYSGLVSNATHTGDVTGSVALTISTNIVDNTKLSDMAANTVKVNATAGTTDPSDLTMGASTILSRLSAGNIVAATPIQIKTLLAISNTDVSGLGTLSTQSGTFSGTSSGTNTGDNATNTTYANDYRAANFIAGTNYLTPTGSAAGLTSFPTLNQNTTGTASTITGNITQSQVTNLTTDLSSKQNNISLSTVGTSGPATFIGTTLNIPNYATGGGEGASTWFDYVIGNTSTNDTETPETIFGSAGISSEIIYKGVTYKRFDLDDDSQSYILTTGDLIVTTKY